jgi:phosphoribosylanthranilate isomerase
MAVKIKICGMKFWDNISEIALLQPDFMGFIFYEKSPRHFGSSISNLPESIQKVGVFVNASLGEILEKTKQYSLDLVQLHGDENPESCHLLQQEKIKVIKSFRLDNQFNFNDLNKYNNYCDYFLFDTKGGNYGGNGIPFDWSVLKNYHLDKPYFLSGGIGLENQEEVKSFLTKEYGKNCIAIDCNSRLEISPGLKSTATTKQLINAFKGQIMQTSYHVDEKGFYGKFGGAFIPEMLYPNVEELRQQYLSITAEPEFRAEFHRLLKEYVGRPTPLYFARRLSDQFNARIYLKREDLCHTGAHKINNTIGQILLAKRLGKTRIIAETGAGQHGVATATVCALMGFQCIVYMGEIDIQRQAPNVARMKMLGAEVRPAISGSKTLKDATNEAIRDWINNPTDTFYIIGSVVGPHPYPDMVARFQSVISEEIQKQLLEHEKRSNPDYIIACVGGGSNAAGAFYHFLDNKNVKLIAVEAAGKGVDSGESAATSILGKIGVIHGSKTLLMQTQDGQITEPYSISAGLDYPGVGPMLSQLFQTKRAEFIAITDDDAMKAGKELAQTEGIIPAIESAHALAVLHHRKFNPEDVIVINLSGRGDKDLNTYINYFNL